MSRPTLIAILPLALALGGCETVKSDAPRTGVWEGMWQNSGSADETITISRNGESYVVEDETASFTAAVREGQLVIRTPSREIAAVYEPTDDTVVIAGHTYRRVTAGASAVLFGASAADNEKAAINDVRTMIAAQAAFQGSNGGWYSPDFECLLRPQGCLPGYPADGPAFAGPQEIVTGPSRGYVRKLVAGPPAPRLDPRISAPRSVRSYAYLLTPVEPGRTGTRSFCGDARGFICFRPDGRVIRPGRNAECPSSTGGCEVFD